MATCRYCLADLAADVVAEWDIFIPLEPPSQNVVKGNAKDYRARRRYQHYRDEYGIFLRHEVAKQSIPPARKLRRAIFTRLYSGRGQPYDRGNLIGGMKPLLDALVTAKILYDDSEEWVQDYYRQHSANTSGVRIQIEELQ